MADLRADKVTAPRIERHDVYDYTPDESLNSRMRADASRRAEQRLRSGEVLPPTQPMTDAMDRAKQLTRRPPTGQHFPWELQFLHGSTSIEGQYNKEALDATSPILDKEQLIAKERWDSLSDSQRETITQQMAAEQKWIHDIYASPSQKPETRELQKFRQALEADLQPYETEREAKIRKVWESLPQSARRTLFEEDELRHPLRGK